MAETEAPPKRPDLPPARPSLKVFGAFSAGMGMRLVEWELGRAVMEMDVVPALLNGVGTLHGGCMSTLLDTALAHCAMYCTVPDNIRSGTTVTLTVNFNRPVFEGSRVTVEARQTGGGTTVFMSVAEARDESGKVVATGQAVGRFRDGCHVPEGIPRPKDLPPGHSLPRPRE
jgi:uncharacterized protein (TIGR00369 family)